MTAASAMCQFDPPTWSHWSRFLPSNKVTQPSCAAAGAKAFITTNPSNKVPTAICETRFGNQHMASSPGGTAVCTTARPRRTFGRVSPGPGFVLVGLFAFDKNLPTVRGTDVLGRVGRDDGHRT